MRLELKKWALPAATALSIVALSGNPANAAGGPPQHATPTAVFATDMNAGANAGQSIPGVAAIVDGHRIPMSDVVLLALRNQRSYIVDQMIQNYVVDRDCKRRGIVVTKAEIDTKVAQLRKALAPVTLEQALAEHHTSLAEVREDFRQSIARAKLVEDQIEPTPMFHCRVILLKYCPPELPANVCSVNRAETDTLTDFGRIQDQLNHGVEFSTLAAQYSDLARDKGGDIGILFNSIHNVDQNIVDAAAKLKKGEVTAQPVKLASGYGYALVQVVSTDGDHPAGETAAYHDAVASYHEIQAQYAGPKHVADLIQKSKITLVTDADLLSGKPLPAAAAIVDGHPILMKDVIAKSMASDGPRCTDMLVESYVVNRECTRRGITVSPAEVDRKIDYLRKQIAPHTLDEALQVHHTTLAQLRRDFEQEIKREKLVEDEIRPTKMVHCRVILVKDTAQTASGTQPADYTTLPGGSHERAGAMSPAQSLVAQIQGELKAGADFGQLAKQYPPDTPANTAGDVGVVYAGMHDIDTSMLNAGLSLGKGQITKDAVKTVDGWCLVQAVSTSEDHPKAEDSLYADALQTYKEQEAEMRIPEFIVGLVKKSKIVYYVHA